MIPSQKENLLRYAWRRGIYEPLTTVAGHPVRVQSPGREPACGEEVDFADAEITVDGVCFRGGIKVFEKSSAWNLWAAGRESLPSVVLLVVAVHDVPAAVYPGRGTLLVAVLYLPAELIMAYDSLTNSGIALCGNRLAGFSELERYSVLTRLMIERLQAKCEHVADVFRENEMGWNDTAFSLVLDTICIAHAPNRRQFGLLSGAVRQAELIVRLERVEQVEALLFGAAGLLGVVTAPDDYTYELRRLFRAQTDHYSVVPLDANRWTYGSQGHGSSLWIVLAQLASFLFRNKDLSARITGARTLDDIRGLFLTGASPYWRTHDYLGAPARECPSDRNFSSSKIDLFVINFVLPFLFFYHGQKETGDAAADALIDYLEQTAPEDNVFTRRWAPYLRIDNALKSQAIVQLSKKYCAGGRCYCCPLGISFLSAVAGRGEGCAVDKT